MAKTYGFNVKIGGNTSELNNALKQTNSQISQTNSMLKDLNKVTKIDPHNTEAYRLKHVELQRAVQLTKDKLTTLKSGYKELDDALAAGRITKEEYQRAWTSLTTEIQKTEGQLKSLASQAEAVNPTIAQLGDNLKVAGEKMEALGNKVTSAGTDLTKTITAPIAAAGGASIKMASDFEDGMAKVQTIANYTEEDLAANKDAILRLSNETGRSVTELSEAEYQAISASVDASKAVDFVATSTNLAKAGFLDTADSVDVLTTIINAYKYDAEDAAVISDKLVQIQNDGKITVNELAESMGRVIPTASALGVGLDDLGSAYAIMTRNGIKARQTTTYMDAMLTELADDGSDVAAILQEKTGKSFTELMRDGNSLGDVLDILNQSVDGNSDAFLNLWGSSTAGKAAQSIVGETVEGYNKQMQKMANATGNVASALETLDTPSAKAKKAINQLKNVGVELGETVLETVAPMLGDLCKSIKDLCTWFNSLDDATKRNIVAWAGIAAAVGPVLVGFGKVITYGGKTLEFLGSIPGAIGKVNGTITTLAAKLGIGAKAGTDAALAADGVSKGFLGISSGAGAAALGIGAVWGAAALLAVEGQKAVEAEWGLTDAQKAVVEQSGALKQAQEERTAAIASTTGAIVEEYDHYRALIDEYNSLIDANGSVKEGYETRASFIQNELCNALGIEYDTLQTMIDQNGRLGTAIDDVIQKQQTEAILAANREKYDEAIANLSEYEKNYVEAYDSVKASEDKLTQAHADQEVAYSNLQKAIDEGVTPEDLRTYQNEYNNTAAAVVVASDAYRDAYGAYQTAGEGYRELQSTIDTYEQLIEASYNNDQDAQDRYVTILRNNMKTASDTTTEGLQEQVDEWETKTAQMAQAVADGKISIDSATYKNCQSALDIARQELAKSESIGRDFDDDLSYGIDRNGYLVRSSASDLGDDALNSADVDSHWLGASFAEGFANGIWDNAYQSEEAASYMSQRVSGIVKGFFGIYSPSRLMRGFGKYLDEGFAEGIANNSKVAINAAHTMASGTMDAISSVKQPAFAGAYGLGGSTTNNSPVFNINISAPVNGTANTDLSDWSKRIVKAVKTELERTTW